MGETFNYGAWEDLSGGKNLSFVCWGCNNKVASEKFYSSYNKLNHKYGSHIFICPHCNAPNLYDDKNKKVLASFPGNNIKNLPGNIDDLYNEVRRCMQSNSFTGAVMLMRKMIMNISVQEGAEENLNFTDYVSFLCDEGIVPRKSKAKADSVRSLGNDANHEIEK